MTRGAARTRAARAGLLAIALAAACRGDAHPAGGAPEASPRPAAGAATGLAAIVPRLPASPEGAAERRAIDRRIELHRGEPEREIALLLERAWIRGRLEDYTEALARSADWVARAAGDRRAWRTRVQVLTRVHEFAAARAALDRLRALVPGPSGLDELAELAAGIDEATGAPTAAAYRAQRARDAPDATTLTRWATSLAAAGRHDDALAVMRRVPEAIHDNPPELLAWILFQWGRIYEQRGEPAAARRFYEASRARLSTVEATVHLAQAIAATAGDPGALVAGALVEDRHPELLALAGKTDEARRAWERYVAALPLAFADHAARFYLGPGHDPARALALARLDRRNRDTVAARTLVAEAALAAGEAALACEAAEGLAGQAREAQLVAWRAFSACGRPDDAARLAAELGIR